MTKQLVVASIMCAILAGTYFATRDSNIRVGMREQETVEVDTKSVTRVAFSGKEKFSIVRENGRFVLVRGEERPVPASPEAMDELFDAVTKIETGVFVTEQSSQHAALKVDDTNGQRVSLFAGDKVLWSMIIGDYSEEGGRYMRAPTENTVYLARGRFWDITRNTMNDFRERRIVGLSPQDIESAYFERGVQHEPLSEESVRIIANLRAVGFVESEPTLKHVADLFKASLERVVVKPKASASQLAIDIASDEKSKKAYAQVEGHSDVYEISDYIYAKLHGVKF